MVTEADRDGKGADMADFYARSPLAAQNAAAVEQYIEQQANIPEQLRKVRRCARARSHAPALRAPAPVPSLRPPPPSLCPPLSSRVSPPPPAPLRVAPSACAVVAPPAERLRGCKMITQQPHNNSSIITPT